MFSYFDFDNNFSNMFKTGQFYARLDYNKFSATKLNAEFVNAHEGLAIYHRGNETDRDTGLIKNETLQAVSY